MVATWRSPQSGAPFGGDRSVGCVHSSALDQGCILMAYSYSNTMTFVSMSKYLLILGTQDFLEHKYCQYLIIMGFGMSILILVGNIWDTQMFPNLDDFILCSCASCMNSRRNQRFFPSKHCQKQKMKITDLNFLAFEPVFPPNPSRKSSCV